MRKAETEGRGAGAFGLLFPPEAVCVNVVVRVIKKKAVVKEDSR